MWPIVIVNLSFKSPLFCNIIWWKGKISLRGTDSVPIAVAEDTNIEGMACDQYVTALSTRPVKLFSGSQHVHHDGWHWAPNHAMFGQWIVFFLP